MADTAAAAAAAATEAAAQGPRPHMPDEGEFNKAVAKAEAEHKEVMDKLVRGALFFALFSRLFLVSSLSLSLGER